MRAWKIGICSRVPLKNFVFGGRYEDFGVEGWHILHIFLSLFPYGRKHIATPPITTAWDKEIKELSL